MRSKDATTVARVDDVHLIVEQLNDELVIFDRRSNKAHLLDARAARVFRAAEGGCAVDQLAESPSGKAEVQLAVAELQRIGLLASDGSQVPRRRALAALGTAAALPMIVSILAPTPAAAASNVALGQACVVGTDTCAVGLSCIDMGPNGMDDGTSHCCTTGQTGDALAGQACNNAAQCCNMAATCPPAGMTCSA